MSSSYVPDAIALYNFFFILKFLFLFFWVCERKFRSSLRAKQKPVTETISSGTLWNLSKRTPGLETNVTSDFLCRQSGTFLSIAPVSPNSNTSHTKESERARLIQSFSELISSFIPIIAASPHQYQESEVNIHYRSPIRNLEKEYIEEDELRRRQEDAVSEIWLF